MKSGSEEDRDLEIDGIKLLINEQMMDNLIDEEEEEVTEINDLLNNNYSK